MANGIQNHNLPYDTHNTYTVLFNGDTISTTVTYDPSTVSRWISETKSINRRTSIVGLDVEWRPSFTRHYQNPIATVQICVGRRCLIFQILHASYTPYSLSDFLSDQNFTFVGVGVKSDLEKLESDYGIGRYARSVDLRKVAAEEYNSEGLRNAGLKELANLVLGKEVEKPQRVTLSEWDNPWLTDEQVQYACVDAYVSFEIGRVLNADSY